MIVESVVQSNFGNTRAKIHITREVKTSGEVRSSGDRHLANVCKFFCQVLDMQIDSNVATIVMLLL